MNLFNYIALNYMTSTYIFLSNLDILASTDFNFKHWTYVFIMVKSCYQYLAKYKNLAFASKLLLMNIDSNYFNSDRVGPPRGLPHRRRRGDSRAYLRRREPVSAGLRSWAGHIP